MGAWMHGRIGAGRMLLSPRSDPLAASIPCRRPAHDGWRTVSRPPRITWMTPSGLLSPSHAETLSSAHLIRGDVLGGS